MPQISESRFVVVYFDPHQAPRPETFDELIQRAKENGADPKRCIATVDLRFGPDGRAGRLMQENGVPLQQGTLNYVFLRSKEG